MFKETFYYFRKNISSFSIWKQQQVLKQVGMGEKMAGKVSSTTKQMDKHKINSVSMIWFSELKLDNLFSMFYCEQNMD